MIAKALTDRQLAFLRFAVAHFGRTVTFPSVREYGAEFGIKSPNGVVCHLTAMVAKGYLRAGDRTARSYVVVGLADRVKRAADEYLTELPKGAD